MPSMFGWQVAGLVHSESIAQSWDCPFAQAGPHLPGLLLDKLAALKVKQHVWPFVQLLESRQPPLF